MHSHQRRPIAEVFRHGPIDSQRSNGNSGCSRIHGVIVVWPQQNHLARQKFIETKGSFNVEVMTSLHNEDVI